MTLQPGEAKRRTLALIQQFKDALPCDRFEDLVELAEHDEWGVALENLFQNLNDFEIELRPEERAELETLGSALGVKIVIETQGGPDQRTS